MLGNKLRRHLLQFPPVVARLAHGKNLQVRVFMRQHLLEAELALDVIAQGQRTGDQTHLAGHAPQEAAHQACRGAPGGGIVDAGIMHALGARHVGDERHHGHAARGKSVDRLAHRRVVEGRHGDTIMHVADRIEGGGQQLAVEHVDALHGDRHALAGHALRHGAHFLVDALPEVTCPVRQHEAEAVFARAGKPRRDAVRLVIEVPDGGFDLADGHPAHAWAAVQHPVHRCNAHTRNAGHILDRHLGHEWIDRWMLRVLQHAPQIRDANAS